PTTADAAPSSSGDAMMGDKGPKTTRVVLGLIPARALGNSHRHLGSTSAFQLKPMYEYLMDTHPETRALIPGLAKSWEVEPNGAGLRFFLEEGVPFHDVDGNEAGVMTADDVAWTREDIVAEESTNSIRGLMRGAEVEIVNDHEIVFRWPKPDADALDFIGNQVGGMEINSRADADTLDVGILKDRPINGTGPYTFVSREQEQNIIYKKLPSPHWRLDADFEEIEVRWIPEASTRLAALLAREVHITNVAFEQEPRVLSAGMKIITGKVNTMRTFFQMQGVYLNDPSDAGAGYKFPDTPLLSKDVRGALNRAIDRDALNDAFFFGLGQKMHAIHVAETHGAFNQRWKDEFDDRYGYNPAAARNMLRAAGYDSNNPAETNLFVLGVTQYSGGEDVIESVAQMWSDVGVKVNLLTWDNAQRSARSRALELNNHITLSVLIAPPILALRLGHHTSPPRGGGVEDFVVEEVFEKARRSLDLDVQNRFIQAATNRIYDEYMSIPLFWVPVHAVVDPEVVDDWIFPGTVSGTWTHFWNIRGTR
ncbi:MAG: ABC transporter substrate-binding protein, partial [Chloroflexota bacterium]|nr:ABC transporter substrate-binding protein [Chloroflexota bacterium]